MSAPTNISIQDSPPGRITLPDSKAIPDELKGRPQWVVWKLETRDGKPTKIPYTPSTGRRASCTDLLTWRTFEEAVRGLETGRYDGVGFMFCSGDPYTGIDLDKCRDPETRELTPEALAIVDAFEGAYMEVSPSGRGVHIIIKGKLSGDKHRRGGLEVYSQERFFTVSGVAL